MFEKIGLKKEEIQAAFDTPDLREHFPPVLDVKGVARLLNKTAKTIYDWVEMGRFHGAVRRQGKHLFFWRDAVIDKIFNGPDWASQSNHKEKVDAVQ